MRCHAAEPGAVTSTVSGLTSPPSLAYREVRRRPARAAARAPRGAALRTGRKGERNTSPGSGARAPVRFGRTARYWKNTAVERRLACALRHWARTPRQAGLLPGCADRRSAPSLFREGERGSKVRPGIG